MTKRYNPKVDELKFVRDEIKRLEKIAEALAKEVSKSFGKKKKVLYGERWIAMEKLSERKGAIDPKAIELKGMDPDKFRKPPVISHSIIFQPRIDGEGP